MNMALPNDEVGLMPDTGAHDGLCGDQWARRQAMKCNEYQKKVDQQTLMEPRHVAGVGNGSQQANYEVELSTGMIDTSGVYHEEVFKAPCLENSGVPGLMGIQSLERNDALTASEALATGASSGNRLWRCSAQCGRGERGRTPSATELVSARARKANSGIELLSCSARCGWRGWDPPS